MESSSGNVPFYSAFGEFKDGYNREEAEAGINENFRNRQRQRRERYLKESMLGSGLGEVAENTLLNCLYAPQTVLQCSEELGVLKEPAELEGGVKDGGDPSSHVTFSDLSSVDVMNGFNKIEVEVHTLREVSKHLDHNLKVAVECIELKCNGFSFDSLLEFLSVALTVIEEGDAHISVTPPMKCEGVLPIKGAENLVAFVQERITPLALSLVSTIYATEWMLRYTMTFINSLAAKDEEEAHLRLNLLADCTRWLGKIDRFIAFAFALELKREIYESFSVLRESAERHVGDLLGSIEDDIAGILVLTFPKQRKQLRMLERSILERVQQVMMFLHEIESSWVPSVKLQVEWRDDFLTRMLERIHLVIAPGFFSASMGFIDEGLYKPVAENETPSPRSYNTLSNKGLRRLLLPHEVPTVLMFTQVEKGRVKEKMDFQHIAVMVKGTGSIVVGLQLCMGARYMLRQCGPNFDEQWGFSMSETRDNIDVSRNAEEMVSHLTNMMQERLRERLTLQLDTLRSFFLT